MTNKLAALLLDAWDDFDRAYDGLSPQDAVSHADGSSFAWTIAHVTNTLDWINVRIRGLDPHPLLGQDRFRFGGPGEADDWDDIRAAVGEVRDGLRPYLESATSGDLDRVYSYEGSIARLRETGLTLRFAVSRVIAHHYFHLGEVASKRERLGHSVGDYPGPLEHSL
jgi:hypothetical protein